MSANSITHRLGRAQPDMSETSQALKNLRAFAIVVVVSFHSVLAYLTSQPALPQPFDSPPYNWMATPILDHARWFGFDLYAAFQYASLMNFMFFLSGVFVWPSLVRKGSLRFLYERLRRIGVPFVLGVALLMPVAYYPVYRVTALDPSLKAFVEHWLALPFWPSGPLWFLWQLFLFDVIATCLYAAAPGAGTVLSRLSASAGDFPGRYFLGLLAISAVAYLPLSLVFGASHWSNFGPFALQPDRPLLYLVYFFAGVGVGAYGYDRGLLRIDGMLARRWYIWLAGTAVTFLLWLTSMAPAFYGHSGVLVDLGASMALVLVTATSCLCLAAMALRFATARFAIIDSLAENAYAIYLVHYVFVVWLQYALLGAALPAIAKAAIVFGGALMLSWSVTAAYARLPLRARAVRAKA